MGTLVLICAVLAATAFGVLVAYGVCQAMFAIFRMYAPARVEASVTVVLGEAQIAQG